MDSDKYVQFINNYRKDRDNTFKSSHHSPISHQEQHDFAGLKYYNPNLDYRFIVEIDEFETKEEIIMATNTGESRIQYILGKVSFDIEGHTHQLQVYQTENDPDYFFVPFTDKTSGVETYGAGRYAELQPDHHNPGMFVLDFNMAYSPMCAYNDNYVCPIPPKANRLKVKIIAGEKNYREY